MKPATKDTLFVRNNPGIWAIFLLIAGILVLGLESCENDNPYNSDRSPAQSVEAVEELADLPLENDATSFFPIVASQGSHLARPNILWIFIDDLNDWIGPLYAHPQVITPNIDQLASQGTIFTRAHVNGISCNSSRISVITGLRPTSTGIFTNSSVESDWRTFLESPTSIAYQNYGENIGEIKSIFQHFQDNGYFTAASGKVFHNNEQQANEPWHINYDRPLRTIWPTNFPLNGLDEYISLTGLKYADWGAIEDAVSPKANEVYTEEDLVDYKITQNALSIFEQLPETQPFFVSVGFLLPHQPHYVPQRMLDLYPLEELLLPQVFPADLEDIPPGGLDLVQQSGGYYAQEYIFSQENEWKKLVAAYLASITYVDEQIGRVLSVLEEKGIAENTIVVLWSDHGYHLGEKQHHGKVTLWDQTVRVPLIIKLPGSGSGTNNVDVPVSSVDIFPTLVELAQLEMPSDFHRDGRSLVPLLYDANSYWPWVTTTSRETNHAVYTSNWAYIRYSEEQASQPNTELYDLQFDGEQWHNLLSAFNGDPEDYADIQIMLETILSGQVIPDEGPVASDIDVNIRGNNPVSVLLSGSDPNQDFLQFAITTLPEAGMIYQSPDGTTLGERIEKAGTILISEPGWSTYVIYVPTGDEQFGSDQFAYSVFDGSLADSGIVTLKIGN